MDAEEQSPEATEVIAALSHERLVRGQLTDLLDESASERSDLLGLVRLRIRDITEAARLLTAKVDLLSEEQRSKVTRTERPVEPLDQVLWSIRALVAADNAGWQPTIGKNRVVSLTISGRVAHGNVGDPEPVTSQQHWPTRGAGPGGGVQVGVIDTGLAPHAWLAGGWTGQYSDLLPTAESYSASAGHATFVSGLILDRAPGANIHVHQLLEADTGEADAWTAAKAIVEMGRTGIDVLNLSFVCYTGDGDAPMAIATAVDRLDPGIVVVAAAGNHGELEGDAGKRPAWPAALDDVVAVGASRSDRQLADFTPRDAPWIDVLAPGADVTSTFLEGQVRRLKPKEDEEPERTFSGYARWSGSSFATALVSGQIAAGVVPGRVTARESWDNILATVRRRQEGATPVLDLPNLKAVQSDGQGASLRTRPA